MTAAVVVVEVKIRSDMVLCCAAADCEHQILDGYGWRWWVLMVAGSLVNGFIQLILFG